MPGETRLQAWQNAFRMRAEHTCIIRCIWAVLYIRLTGPLDWIGLLDS